MTEYNGGFVSYPDRTAHRTFYRADDRYTKTITVKSGQVLKANSFIETDTAGKAIAHSGMVEKALVTFAAITSAQTLILGGLTFTAGSSGTSIADLVEAFSGLTAGMTASQANTANPVSGGTFTAGTLGSWNIIKSSTTSSVVFVSTTPNADVTNIADTGTATDPTITITAGTTLHKPIAGMLCHDVDASAADVDTEAYTEVSMYAENIIWSVDPATDIVTKVDGTTVTCTDYYTGATTDLLKKKFVEGSEFDNLGFLSSGETYV